MNNQRVVIGVSPEKVEKIMKEFATTINNPPKLYHPLYLTPAPIEIEGVSESSNRLS